MFTLILEVWKRIPFIRNTAHQEYHMWRGSVLWCLSPQVQNKVTDIDKIKISRFVCMIFSTHSLMIQTSKTILTEKLHINIGWCCSWYLIQMYVLPKFQMCCLIMKIHGSHHILSSEVSRYFSTFISCKMCFIIDCFLKTALLNKHHCLIYSLYTLPHIIHKVNAIN